MSNEIPYPAWTKEEKDILGADFAGAGGRSGKKTKGAKKRAKAERKFGGGKRAKDDYLGVEKGFI